MTAYCFDRFELRPAQRQLLVGGAPAGLGARAFDVLLCLVEGRDRVLTKDEILHAAWPGVIVEESNLSVQVSALRKVLGARSVVTVAGRGYRFGFDVREVAPAPASGAERPAIAVLAFSSASESPQIRLLADGLAQDVITLLARVPGFTVISRASSFLYRDRPAEAARDLGVRYVVEGTLRSAGSTALVTTHLVDATCGQVLETAAFESPLERASDLQEGIARGIIVRLQPQLARAEIAVVRRQRIENLDAWAHYHHAVVALGTKGWCEEAVVEARRCMRAALECDPSFALAHALHSLLGAMGWNSGVIEPWPGMERELIAEAEYALSLDGDSSEVMGLAGCTMCDLGRLDHASELLHLALEADPSNPQVHVALGALLAARGNLVDGMERMRLGIRLSPRDRRLGLWDWALSNLLFKAGRFEESLHEARLAAQRDPRIAAARFAEAAALMALGRADDALPCLRRARELQPRQTAEGLRRAHGDATAACLSPLWETAAPER